MSPSDRNLNSFIAYRNVNANSNCTHKLEYKLPILCTTPFHNLKCNLKRLRFKKGNLLFNLVMIEIMFWSDTYNNKHVENILGKTMTTMKGHNLPHTLIVTLSNCISRGMCHSCTWHSKYFDVWICIRSQDVYMLYISICIT